MEMRLALLCLVAHALWITRITLTLLLWEHNWLPSSSLLNSYVLRQRVALPLDRYAVVMRLLWCRIVVLSRGLLAGPGSPRVY